MADQMGRAVTYSASQSPDFRELLLALYTWILADNELNWEIDTGVTLPTPYASAGDKGFVIKDKATGLIQIAIADHAGVGGIMVDGGSVGTSDDLVMGICPGGGITDITSGGFTVGTRWSGWVADSQGVAYGNLSGRTKVSSGPDWFFFRNKGGASGYEGGGFAGKIESVDGGLGEGYVVFGGIWADYSATSTNDHRAFEAQSAVWKREVGCLMANQNGLVGDFSTDGGGVFRTTPVFVAVYSGTMGSNWQQMSPVGKFPPVFTAASGTIAKDWKNGASDVVGYNMDGGCWQARDDGTDLE